MATITWIGAVTTLWSNASNWSPAVLPTSADNVVFNNSANCTINISTTVNSIDCNGYTGTLSSSSAANIVTIAGSNDGTATGISLRFSTGMTVTSTPQFTFTSSIGGYIYCNGKSLTTTITFNNATGVWSNQDALTTSGNITITTGTLTTGASLTQTAGTFTLTAGTLNLGSYTHSFNIFSSSNANTRTINFGTSTVNITGNATTVWTTATVTGLTVLGTSPTVNFTYSGSTGTRVISFGALSEANSINVNISAGSDTITLPGASFKSLNFTGFSGTNTIGNSTFYGNLTLSPTQTLITVGILTFAGTSVTQTITSSGITIPTTTLTINSATTTVQNSGALTTTGALTLTTGTFNINGNLTIGLASTFTFTAGTINANNGANISCGLFVSSNSNTRTLNMGSGTWTLTSTATVWNLGTSTGMTLNAQQSRILINNTASPATGCTFSGGGLTYYTVEHTRGASTGTFSISGSGTVFANFIDNTSSAAHNITFAQGGTYSFYKFNVRGSAGAIITINTTGGTPTPVVKLGQGIVCYCDYLSIGGAISATPANTWYAGANSTTSTASWIATAAPSSQSLLGAGGVG